jgi:hypothetical protein
MSYNQAYEQDSGENVSYNSLYSLDVIRRNTLLPVIRKPPSPPIPPEEMNPTYTFQVTFKHDYIIPDEVKAFNFNDIQINLQSAYTTLIPHNGHAGQDGYDLSKLFDNNTIAPAYVWWDVLNRGPYPILIYPGDQLFSVTIPSLPGDTLRDRQVKYFEITWEERNRSAGFIILRNSVIVHDDGPTMDGYGNVRYTRRYDLPLPDVLA